MQRTPRGELETIEAVAAYMEEIAAPLAENDGVRRFNELYLTVTRAVAAESVSATFEDTAFITRLDVVFADLYFEAVEDLEAGRKPSRAWAPLFEARAKKGIAPLQFAIAGMNAHINHDLPIALVQTSEEQGVVPRRGSPEHRDFERVNAILEVVAERVKEFLATGIVGEVDQDLGRLDDVVALWSVRKARETAYTNGEILWQLRGAPVLSDAFLKNLDRLVGLSSRGLLVPH